MASFQQHINTAVVSTGIFITPLYVAELLTQSQAIVVLLMSLIGTMAPDLDSDSSIPIRIVFKVLSLFFPLLILFAVAQDMTLFEIFITWGIATIALHLIFFRLFLVLTKHRRVFHSVPMAILMSQLVSYSFYIGLNEDILFSTIVGGFFLFGFLIHLLLDELISLNLLGLHFKQSLGSAFKIIDKNNLIGTGMLYLFIALMFLLMPNLEDVRISFSEAFVVLSEMEIF